MAMHGQVWDPKKDGDGLGECAYSAVWVSRLLVRQCPDT
jgi:hypothetical protein